MRKTLLFTAPILVLTLLSFFIQPLASQTPVEETQREYEYLEENEGCLKCHGHTYFYYYNDWVERDIKERMNPYYIVDSAQFYVSNHWNFRCVDCHSEDYQEFPHAGELRMEPIYECLDCHGAHLEEQTATDCFRCHQTHQPLQIVPSGYLPASFCRVCHQEAARNLAETNTNHVGINCVSCHKGQHPSTPACQDCHGLPHSQVIHSKHQNCLECHVDAHRLISGR